MTTPKRHINLPGFGPLHIAAFIPVALLAMGIVGVVAFAVIDVALHPPTPEERAARQAEREAKKDQEAAAAAARGKQDREKIGYIDDPEIHKTAEGAIRSAGYSCPGVHGVRAMGDKGRGQVLRVQCMNNVFFLLTIQPGGRTYTVEIND